jgi:hypothetical protein
MNDDKLSTVFERQIERIHQLLEGESSKVTWNDKIPDPDNPDQLRQIDITIDRDGTIVHAECRIHQSPQDVTWIEELIGRRASLGADAVIAVSSSGFTEGAVKKAAAFNIHLRTLAALTDDEVRLWANRAKAWLVFYEFTDCRLVIDMSCDVPSEPASITKEDGTAIPPLLWRALFEPLMMQFGMNEAGLDNDTKFFEVEVGAPILVNGQRPTKMLLYAGVRRLKQPVPLDGILKYADPNAADRALAQVQKHADDVIEIIQSSDEVAFVADPTYLEVPPNAFFHTVIMDFERPVSVHWVKFVNAHFAMQSDVQIQAMIKYPGGAKRDVTST